MVKPSKGFTLIEALLTSVMVVAIIGAVAYMFQVVIIGWSGQGARAGASISANKAVEELTRELRNARVVMSPSTGEIRFTKDGTNYYIFYFYNALDSYPPQFTSESYQLKKASLSGGSSGTFTYGSGDLIARDILPFPSSTLTYDGGVITMDLVMQRGSSIMHCATKIKPRNI
ncbi:MAG: type II secretion system protein [Candidatus Omnitrophota bacterium]